MLRRLIFVVLSAMIFAGCATVTAGAPMHGGTAVSLVHLPLYPGQPAVYPGNANTMAFFSAKGLASVSACETPTAPGSGGTTWYSSPTGSDQTGDGSFGNPFGPIGDTTGNFGLSGNSTGLFGNGMFSAEPAKFFNDTGTFVGGGTTRYGHPAPIHPGDTIVMMGGQHGYAWVFGATSGIQGAPLDGFDGANSTQWTKFVNYPGQVPVVAQLKLSAGRFSFTGITFQALNLLGTYVHGGQDTGDNYLVSTGGGSLTHDLVFNNVHVQSAPLATVQGWDLQTWLTTRSSGFSDNRTDCLTITNSRIENVGFAIGTQRSTRTLIAGNTIDHVVDDGIDHGNNHIMMVNNTITNLLEDGDLYHSDCIQGVPADNASPITDIDNENNTCLRITDANDVLLCTTVLKMCPKENQGNGYFDGPVWQFILWKNNVALVNDSNCMSFFGFSHGVITGNICGYDSAFDLFCTSLGSLCSSTTPGIDRLATQDIDLDHQKGTGTGDNDVTLTNNYFVGLGLDHDMTALTSSGNTCFQFPAGTRFTTGSQAGSLAPCGIIYWATSGAQAGQQLEILNPGTYTTVNGTPIGTTILSGDATTVFKVYDTANYNYDLRPGP